MTPDEKARAEAERRHAAGELYALDKSRITTFKEGAAWQRSQPVEITEGALFGAIKSVTDCWPEPLTDEETVGIAVAVRAALSAALGGERNR